MDIGITFNGAEPELLDYSRRGDGGQRVLKITHEGTPMVLKCYGMKRGRLKTVLRQFGSLFIVGKSSITARGRHETEREVLALWTQEGFDVPKRLSVPELERKMDYCLVLEWLPGSLMTEALQQGKMPLPERIALVERFGRVFCARHDRAAALDEPRLLLENPTFDHVFVSRDRLVHFDFEIVFRKTGDIERLIRREIVGFTWSMAKMSGSDFPALLETMVSVYPARHRFALVLKELKQYGNVPVMAWVAPFQGFIRKKARYAKRGILTDALEKVMSRLEDRND
ncbi:MAG: hypothetical protein ACYTG7_06810 [Planctomycetota bacterium]|jgi:hypothetical protein